MSQKEHSSDPAPGTVLADKYRIVRLLGRGGMGSVHEAEHVELGKRVALKFLHLTAQEDETTLARFQREARVICAIKSDHIVEVFDWGQDEGSRPFLVMELLEGRDLAAYLKQRGRLGVQEAVRFAVEALRGLKRVHAAGIVHRDLKPENLFLVRGDDERLHVKIVDFGLSKLMDGAEPVSDDLDRSARLTQQGALVGTPLYMSPEQVEGVDTIDHRSDLWAMSAILYEALSGSPPFMDRSYARLVMAICQQDPPDLCARAPDVPPALGTVVARGLARNRDERFHDTDELAQALEEALAQPSTPVATVPSLHQEASDTVPSVAPDTPLPDTPALQASPTSRTAEDAAVDEAVSGLDATIAAHTRGAATVWLADVPAFSIWRGEVDSPDRLRIETRDGTVRDLRLEPVGELRLGRVRQVKGERNDLVYPDVASRLAAKLHHDGVRWWLERRQECSVPVQVGTRALQRGEQASLVHGSLVTVGAMRATMVDRRYVSRSVPAGTVDPLSGLLGRGGLEQELATALQQQKAAALLLVQVAAERAKQAQPASVRVAVALHRQWPSAVIARDGETVALILRGEPADQRAHGERALDVAAAQGARTVGCGFWTLSGEAVDAASELELALDAIVAASGPGAARDAGRDGAMAVVDLREAQEGLRLAAPAALVERAGRPKNQMLLFAIEDQAALEHIGSAVVAALERELCAVVATQVGPSVLLSRMAPGIVAACVPRKIDAAELGVAVQCEWHARPPVTDGKVELPRTLSWEETLSAAAEARAQELSRECRDAHGVLSALSGGLPYPIAGRVHAAIAAASAVERVKMLFDVLEGTWRFIAVVLASAYLAKAKPERGDHQALRAFHDRVKTRAGLPLGAWRELSRIAVKSFEGVDDPIGQLARQLLGVKLSANQTFDTLSNLLHSERNAFAHGHYTEARAEADVREFEQMTRTILRALRPLAAWTLVTVQRTEPDLYGELQTVEFIDHTGPYAAGARRRIGLNSPIRLANVVYLARWRDGLVLPLEPFLRYLAAGDRYELFWMDHLPRAGPCTMSAVVSGETVSSSCDPRRLPPLLRSLLEG